ncbi:MAG: hypothetical protein RMY34_36595 [Aulosira sp. DedQUE10]|nr:hypothetical protein [Aulosira sp. DedQUE10]
MMGIFWKWKNSEFGSVKGERDKGQRVDLYLSPFPLTLFPNLMGKPLPKSALTLARDNNLRYGDRNRFWY